MRTGSGKRSSYNRTTGSRTARLYSRRTAKKINKIYLNEEAKIIRTEEYYGESRTAARSFGADEYNDYYDDLSRDRKSGAKTKISTIIITASLIIVVLALVIAGLALLKPKDNVVTDLVKAPKTEPESVPASSLYGDSAAPEIFGVIPIVVYAGNSVAYKDGVYLEDDNDPSPVLEIENEGVDLTTPGIYPITYVARDADGNVTREVTTVTVLAGTNLISQEEINKLADLVLETIIPDDTISDEMKCLKVYEYLHAIGYVDEVHSEDWMQNAYWMLTKREGDCFCYYSASRLLLSRLGYEVMEVRNNNNYVHYWCLVSIDGGATWWHFDPCCWSWGEDGILCLVSDKYLSEFTRRHITSDGRLIHAWDLVNYPSTPEADFWTDEDREVIYEGGLIDVEAQYDPNDERWNNDGWESYQVPNYWEASDWTEYDYNYDDTAYDPAAYEESYDGAEDMVSEDYDVPADPGSYEEADPAPGVIEEIPYEEEYVEQVFEDTETGFEGDN